MILTNVIVSIPTQLNKKGVKMDITMFILGVILIYGACWLFIKGIKEFLDEVKKR